MTASTSFILQHIPTETSDVEKWFGLLLEKAILEPEHRRCIVELSPIILANNEAGFKLKHLRKLIEAHIFNRIRQDFSPRHDILSNEEILHQHNLIKVIILLCENELVTPNGVLDI